MRRLAAPVVLALLLLAAPASASISYESTFGSNGSGSGELSSPAGVAVDSVGNVYVADGGNERIDKFDSSGSFVEAWGWGVNGGVGFETCTLSCQAGTSGGGAGELAGPRAVAIDSSDNLYVGDEGNHRVDKFSSSGSFTEAWGWGVSTGASQFETCTSTCQAGIAGAGAGQIDQPFGIAVDASSVYVSDRNENRVDKFSSSGSFTEAWGWGVSTGASQFETCTASCQAGMVGDGAGQFDIPLGIATGSGSVYVADGANNRIDEFSAAGSFVRAWGWGVSDGQHQFETCTATCVAGSSGGGAGELNAPFGVATDSAGNVYVGDNDNERIDEFTSTDSFVVTWGWGVADDNGQFETCTSGCFGGLTGSGAGQFDTPQGVAIHGTNIYVADSGNSRVEQFSGASVPSSLDVTTGSAHAITGTRATVTGLVDPNGTDANYWFEYGTDTNYGHQTPMDDAGTDNGFVGEADLTGLSPGTTYHYRIVGQQGSNTPVTGADRTFTTLGPRLSNITVGSITVSGATVSLHVDPAGKDTQVHVDYGTDSSYGSSTGSTAVPNAGGAQTVQFPLSGLKPGTTYHFRVVASNGDATSQSGDLQFATTACPACAAPGVSQVAQTQSDSRHDATISALVDPHGLDTQVHVDYGTDTSYGNSSSTIAVPAGAARTVQLPISGLTPASVYHYKVIATNPIGSTDSGDQTFTATCPECAAPTITQAQTVLVDFADSRVTVSALIDPRGFDTQVRVLGRGISSGANFNDDGMTRDTTAQSTTVPADAGPTLVQFTFQLVPQGTLNSSWTYGYEYDASNAAGAASTPAIASGGELQFKVHPDTCGAHTPPSFPNGAGTPGSITPSSVTISDEFDPGFFSAKLSAVVYETGTSPEQGLVTAPLSISAGGSRTVSVTADHLKPATSYTYYLIAAGCTTVQTQKSTFTTSAATTPKTATVSGRSANVRLGCDTQQACAGTATLQLGGSGGRFARAAAAKHAPTILGQTSFTIRGHHRATVHVKLTPAGRRLLHRHHRLKATLRITFRRHGKKPYTVTDPIRLVGG